MQEHSFNKFMQNVTVFIAVEKVDESGEKLDLFHGSQQLCAWKSYAMAQYLQ